MARYAAASVAAAALAATAVVGSRHQTGSRDTIVRRASNPTLKPAADGSYVRWQSDAVDVVVDKTFSDLGGDSLFGAALDAWRASGATLPSVSTIPGEHKSVGYDMNGPNENVVVYAEDGWEKAHGALAITILTYDNDTGKIVDADVLVNGGGRYFQQFDQDQSSPDDQPVSIENPTGGTSAGAKTARFDLQSVVTHELGHFFGLGEDYDNTKGTMYIATRPGEINKRVLSTIDSDAVTALYASSGSDAQATRGGCGRAQMAPTGPAPYSWIGFAAAALGLGLLAASRRARASEARVRVAASRQRVRRMARFGGWLTVVGLGLFAAPANLDAAADRDDARGDADVEIVRATPHWVDGIIETELTYRVTECHVGQCPEGEQRLVALGGTLGGVTQVVGPFAAPKVGARLHIDLRQPRSFEQMLGTTFKP